MDDLNHWNWGHVVVMGLVFWAGYRTGRRNDAAWRERAEMFADELERKTRLLNFFVARGPEGATACTPDRRPG